jgi:hypothetical protein
MLKKIELKAEYKYEVGGSHSGVAEDSSLLGCDAGLWVSVSLLFEG